MTSISVQVFRSLKHVNVTRGDALEVFGLDIILGRNMHKIHEKWRDLRHDIVIVRNAEVVALLRDEVTQSGFGDSRGAVRVKIDFVFEVPKVGGS